MNRTKGIFITAGLLASLALFLMLQDGRGAATTTPTPPPTDGPVTLRSMLSHSHLPMGGDGTVYLDLDLRGAKLAVANKRVPLNVALVIDRSGSMAGDKLAHARAAAKGFVQRLRAGDRVAVVTYGSDVSVLVSSTVIERSNDGSRQAILAAIDNIADRGGTFLSGGLEAGKQQVRQYLTPNQVGRVILISDGQANEGVTSADGLSALARQAALGGVSVTTVGVGLRFNEDVMTAMAEAGSGHYYFVNNSSDMSSIFSKELDILVATVAKAPKLTIELRPGVRMVRVYGYDFTQVGQRVVVALPDVYSEQQRKLICELHVPTDRAAAFPVANVSLGYTEVGSQRAKAVATVAHVVVTTDAAAVASGKRRDIIARVTEAQVARRIKQAMKSYSDGDVGGAQRRLRGAINKTRVANRGLNSPALNRALKDLKAQLETSQRARPGSAAGRRLIKRSKAQAYDMFK